MTKKLPLLLFLLLVTTSLYAESGSASPAPDGFYNRWMARTSATQDKQPPWAVPLVTTTTGLIQVVRSDYFRQIAPARTITWNMDGSKGVNIVPWANTELAVNLPPYIEHNSTAKDGAGDVSFLGKYRIATGNAQRGLYNVSAWLVATIPTGSYKNGAADVTLAPNLGVGKGYGRFDVQSTAGATLPMGKTALNAAGRPVAWNIVAQYRVSKILWPEIESNATFYKGGGSDGKTQEFVTPGLIVGKCGLHPSDPKSRPGLAVGVGMQIATSQFHTYNHGLVLTGRWIF
jgi:hypothetical protein